MKKEEKEELKQEEEKNEKTSKVENPKESVGENIDDINNNVQSDYEKEFRKILLGEKNIDVFHETLSAKGIKTIINFIYIFLL